MILTPCSKVREEPMNGPLDISPQSIHQTQPAVLKSEIEENLMGEMTKPVPILPTTPTIEQMNQSSYPYVFIFRPLGGALEQILIGMIQIGSETGNVYFE